MMRLLLVFSLFVQLAAAFFIVPVHKQSNLFSIARSGSDPIAKATSLSRRTTLWATEGSTEGALMDNGKNSQIQQFQQPSSVVNTSMEQLQQRSPTDLAATVIQYQQQLQSLMLQAHQEKLRAVREAEDAIMAQWAASLSSTTTTPSIAAKTAARSSRWGDMEVARVLQQQQQFSSIKSNENYQARSEKILAGGQQQQPQPQPLRSSIVSMTTPTTTASPADATRIAEADHGLRADGGVGGPSLAERVQNGSGVVPVGPPPLDEYQKRNAKLVAPGSNKTRWGLQEIARVAQQEAAGSLEGGPPSFATGPAILPSSVVTIGSIVPTRVPEATIAEADHGMRADGGVGGPSLEERVNVGAQIVLKASPITSNMLSEYEQRNANLVSAGNKKSRWGPQEIARIQSRGKQGTLEGGPSSSALPRILPSSIVTIQGSTTTPSTIQSQAPSISDETIAAADHGLRADGGVGGPTLSDRLSTSVGATIVAVSVSPFEPANGHASPSPVTTNEYQQRNDKILAAGDKNTRWGPQEIARIQPGSVFGLVTGGPPSSTSSTFLPSSVVTMSTVSDAKIAAADHGLRADGGVEGPTLADRVRGRVNIGSDIVLRQESNEYERRNAKILAEGSKNSRWGEQEIARIQDGSLGLITGGPTSSAKAAFLPSSVVTINGSGTSSPSVGEPISDATIAAADHGLRADGGVGGPSLADRLTGRVNAGAQIVSNQAEESSLFFATSSVVSNEYAKRNEKIINAGVKNTRWGDQEIARIQSGTAGFVHGGPPSSSTSPVLLRSSVVTLNDSAVAEKTTTLPRETIAAADHGLRADGGVGGPTLADRLSGSVNVGAQIVNAASTDLYQQRNSRITAASEKTRWGEQEVNKVKSGSRIGSVNGQPSPTTVVGSNVGAQIVASAS